MWVVVYPVTWGSGLSCPLTVLLGTRRVREMNWLNKRPYSALAQGGFAAGRGGARSL